MIGITWRSSVSGMILAIGVLASNCCLSSTPTGNEAAHATTVGLAIYSYVKPAEFFAGKKPPADRLSFGYQIGAFQFSSLKLGPTMPRFDSTGRRLTFAEFLQEQDKVQPLLDQLAEAFKSGYTLDEQHDKADLSCLRNGLNGYNLRVIFSDGMLAAVRSDQAHIYFHDAIPLPPQLARGQAPIRINVPDHQLINDARIFGMITARAYQDPCAGVDALRGVGDGDIKELTYTFAHMWAPQLPTTP